MPINIDPETINADELPGIWSPIQWELSEEEYFQEMETQATASLLWTIDMPEALLRLALDEVAIERIFEPPVGYDPEIQGEWDESLVTFQFKRSIRPIKIHRQRERLYIEYAVESLGNWAVEIETENVQIYRI